MEIGLFLFYKAYYSSSIAQVGLTTQKKTPTRKSASTMKKLSLTLIGLSLLSSPPLFAGKVYRVMSEDGQVTYTDSPPANAQAETIDMPETNITVAPPPPAKKDNKGEAGEDEVAYTRARITQPDNNATIPPGHREVVVQITLEPLLQTGHLVQLYIDGRKQGSPTAASTFTVTSLDRGRHSLRAEVIGADKKRKTRTQTVVFHVKQHSANSNSK